MTNVNKLTKRDRFVSFAKGLPARLLPEQVRGNWSYLVKWLLIGLTIRLIISPFLISTDSIIIMWRSYALMQNHALVPMGDPLLISLVVGPLLVTFCPSVAQQVFGDVISNVRFSPFVASIPLRMSCEGVPSMLLIYKLPYLFLDLALAFLLLRFFDDAKKSLLAFKLWWLNPISIFITFAIGQYDIFPVFFMILAFYFLKVNRPNRSALSLGISSIFKWYALPFIFPIAFIYSKQVTNQHKTSTFLKYSIFGLLPVVLGFVLSLAIPTYYESVNAAFPTFEYYNGFLGSRLFIPWYPISSPLLANLFIFIVDFSSKLQLFQGVDLYIAVFSYGLFFFASVFYDQWNFQKTWKAVLVFFLVYYAFSYFHAQWFLWMQPFLIFLVAKNRRYLKLFPFFVLLFFIYIFYWDAAVTSALLIPIIPQAWLWPGPIGILNGLGLPAVEVLNIFRSFLSALCILTSIAVILSFEKDSANA